jgi:hypothetical protein
MEESPEHIVGTQKVLIVFEEQLVSLLPAMWLMLKSSVWDWKQESKSRKREKHSTWEVEPRGS